MEEIPKNELLMNENDRYDESSYSNDEPYEEEKPQKEKRTRYKEYKCTFPGCKEGLKTKYNCISHIWDIHLKAIANDKNSYKSHPNKEYAKKLCEQYLFYDNRVENGRKRRPYDCPTQLLNHQEHKPSTLFENSPLNFNQRNINENYVKNENMSNYNYNDHNTMKTNDRIAINYTYDEDTVRKYNDSYNRNDNYNSSTTQSEIGLHLNLNNVDPFNNQGNMNNYSQVNSINGFDPNNQVQLQSPPSPQSPPINKETSCYDNSETIYKNYDSLDNFSYNPSVNQGRYSNQNSQQMNYNFQQCQKLAMENSITANLLSYGDDFIRVYSIAQNIKRLHVYGQIMAENGFLQRSDKRYKKDIKKISNALEIIGKISGKSYRYKNDEKNVKYGFIAQELKEVLPDLVQEDEDGMLSIDPLSLIPFIVEALKELQQDLKKVQQTNQVVNLKTEVNNCIDKINEVKSDKFIFSLGPSEFVVPVAISLSFISAFVAIYGNYPFIWIYLVFASVCFWTSHQFAPNGTFTNLSIGLNFVLLNILLVSVAISFLMGTSLQIFLGIYVSLMLLLWGCSQSINTSFLNYFIVSFSFSCIACWIVFMIQPTFSCNVSTPMKQNIKLTEYLEYTNSSDVRFDLTSDIPWNCFNPRLEVVGNKVKFLQEKSTSVVVDPDTLTTDRINVNMICSSVSYKCNSYTISPVKKAMYSNK